MHAIMMVAALQLQMKSPEPAPYKLRTTYHLHQALPAYRQLIHQTSLLQDRDALIATSFLLAIHASATPIFEPAKPSEDRLISLFTGIRTIVWHIRARSDVGIFWRSLTFPLILPSAAPVSGPALQLQMMIYERQSALKSSGTYATYIEVVESLTLLLDIAADDCEFEPQAYEKLMMHYIRWLSFLPRGFVVLVNVYEAEALVIMAYYYAAVGFVLRKLQRSWWWWRERPAFMCREISKYLGRTWAVWMRWPEAFVGSCHEQVAVSILPA